MEVNFKNLRVPADYPTYPPYHTGDYLEEYFYKFYKENKEEFDKTGYTYIPVFWTNVYLTSKNKELLPSSSINATLAVSPDPTVQETPINSIIKLFESVSVSKKVSG